MKKILFATIAMLTLFTGQAVAQRLLPGMSAVEVHASMVDGFYSGNSRDCGYAIGINYLKFVSNHANTWSFGGEYLQTYKSYAEKGRIPIAQYTGEAGYNLHLLNDYSHTFHLYAGVSALAGYECINNGKSLLSDGATIKAEDAFIYGGAVNVAIDFYLSDNFALGFNAKERFVFGNDTNHTHFNYGVSLKYAF